MDSIYIMDWVCLTVTVLMFMTGISPCHQMYKSNSTKNVPYLFFLLSIISCTGMFHYGLLISNSTITFINAIGGFLQICYTLTYVYVAKPKGNALAMLTATVMYLSGLYWYLLNFVEDDKFADTLGLASSTIISIIAILPLIEVVQNVRNKNSDGTPPIMIIGGLMCGISWLIYGLLLQDANIYRPNIPGIAVATLKLAAITYYSNPTPKIKKIE